MKLLALTSVLLLVAGCGSSTPPPGPSPTPGAGGTPVQVTELYSGSTVQVSSTSCTGDSHDITATDGDISVRLTATSDPAGALSIQVCGAGVDDSNCTIRQQRIAVDQVLAGAKRGASTQNVKLLPYACVFGGTPAGAPVMYTVSLTYFRLQ